jgi:hypothetical protein
VDYLFLAIPNFCGSTLFYELIKTCTDVSALPNIKDSIVSEGNMFCPKQYKNLLGPHSIEANMEHVYSDPENYNWTRIKEVWDSIWEYQNSSASLRVQKTPADIYRIKQINEHFPNLKWILSVRDPYAYIESIIRKSTFRMDPDKHIELICYQAGRVLELQLENKKLLGDNAYTVTYEDFCARPKYHKNKLSKFVPQLKDMNLETKLLVKGIEYSSIKNTNEYHIRNMIKTYPNILERINEHLLPFMESMYIWGYPIRLKENLYG